jgi:hypothetical protein
VGNTVSQHTNDIANLTKQLNGEDGNGGFAQDIADNASAIDELNQALTNPETGLEKAHTKAKAAQTAADNAQDAADAAQAAADKAQKRADDAYNLADTKATMADVEAKDYANKTEAQDYAKAVQGETDKTVKDIETAASNAQSAADNAQATANTADGKADQALTAIGDDDSGLIKRMNAAEEAIGDANEAIQGLRDDIGHETSGLAAAHKAAKNAQDTADAKLNLTGGTLTGALTLSGAPTEDLHAATKSYVDTGVEEAKQLARDLVAGNDAMTFKGVVHATTDLPSTGTYVKDEETYTVNCGDTYKVGTAGKYADNVEAKVGDLFINTAKDGETPVWVHISSGYEDDYLQKLVYDADSNVIALTNGIDTTINHQGDIKIVADANSSATVSTATTDGHIVVTVGMEWGSF